MRFENLKYNLESFAKEFKERVKDISIKSIVFKHFIFLIEVRSSSRKINNKIYKVCIYIKDIGYEFVKNGYEFNINLDNSDIQYYCNCPSFTFWNCGLTSKLMEIDVKKDLLLYPMEEYKIEPKGEEINTWVRRYSRTYYNSSLTKKNPLFCKHIYFLIDDKLSEELVKPGVKLGVESKLLYYGKLNRIMAYQDWDYEIYRGILRNKYKVIPFVFYDSDDFLMEILRNRELESKKKTKEKSKIERKSKVKEKSSIKVVKNVVKEKKENPIVWYCIRFYLENFKTIKSEYINELENSSKLKRVNYELKDLKKPRISENFQEDVNFKILNVEYEKKIKELLEYFLKNKINEMIKKYRFCIGRIKRIKSMKRIFVNRRRKTTTMLPTINENNENNENLKKEYFFNKKERMMYYRSKMREIFTILKSHRDKVFEYIKDLILINKGIKLLKKEYKKKRLLGKLSGEKSLKILYKDFEVGKEKDKFLKIFNKSLIYVFMCKECRDRKDIDDEIIGDYEKMKEALGDFKQYINKFNEFRKNFGGKEEEIIRYIKNDNNLYNKYKMYIENIKSEYEMHIETNNKENNNMGVKKWKI